MMLDKYIKSSNKLETLSLHFFGELFMRCLDLSVGHI